VEVVPNDCADTIQYFGLLDFVKESEGRLSGQGWGRDVKKWKCIVWDLDNTLWDGVLIEDGREGIRVRPEIVSIICEMDQRGILHSIAGKNNHQEAMSVLTETGLSEYFLHPQIGWGPRSESIAQVARLLNIDVDAIAFVDDQVFEREEVRSGLPQVAVVDLAQCVAMPPRPECQVPVTRSFCESVGRPSSEK
jgi:HAD superfamily phosphatase (TIGR01681 family)